MCNSCADTKQLSSENAFAERLLGLYNSAAATLMISVGHRTGLFDAMAEGQSYTSVQLAERTGLSERYIREWLGAMTASRIVSHDPEKLTYSLPAEHAALLTRAASPNNLATAAQWFAVLGGVEDRVVEAFGHGKGVPYHAYNRFHEVMAEESGQTVVGALDEHIVPMVEGMHERLAQGVDALDIGCGAGRAMLHLAGRYPKSRFVGYDLSEEAVAMANDQAKRSGISNAQFKVVDLAAMNEHGSFDVIFAFDAIHDQAQPDRVLSNIRAALREGGMLVMQDIQGSGSHAGDMDHPLAPFIYTISCMHCMSVSLANGGPGLGAAWGKQTALRMLDEAGFRSVDLKTLDHDPMNYWYLARL